ncbi:metal ABC transporter permease [Streptomyces fuscigenes]|uniref:metal ABC transporter permease n=1 Tax=Streptomyces fuscigenes TaxID=1528880 RepID=UPI001F2985FE|nr:metal ABC transporter permease [Streptomyces fuscigenes]MCF3960582.1 metal ABC transporter permease [Streptomyces fuscigenes]
MSAGAAAALLAAGAGTGHGPLAAFTHPFFLHAFLAGSAIALAAGLTGYFLVLRAQMFTGDALSHVAFTGALAALAGGYDLRLGLFAGTIAVALLIGGLGRRGRADDVAIGSVFAWILGLGAFFLTLYTTSRSAGNGGAGVNVLFGSVFGLSGGQALTAGLVAAGICVAVLAIARPLLFASVDEAVAAARGVPVRLLGLAFLVLVGACAAEATQAVGSLLLLGLLAAPAGAAVRLTGRPLRGLALSAALGLGEMWAGLALSYAVPVLPPSFCIMAAATAVYGLTYLKGRARTGARQTPPARPARRVGGSVTGGRSL